MAQLGKRNTLEVATITESGNVYLDGGDLGEILIPGNYLGDRIPDLGDSFEVFVYCDSEDRPVATTETPLAMVGDFAALEVVDLHQKAGAFLDWGLGKDLLLPFREQAGRVNVGDRVVVRVLVDERSGRIVASMRLSRFLDQKKPTYRAGEKVHLLVIGHSPLGYNAIVNGRHQGLIYASDTPGTLEVGQRTDGFVRAVRPEGGIDLALTEAGFGRVAPLSDLILEALRRNGGQLDLDDKSAPEEILRQFGTSKKAFKQAIGGLYKKRLIVLAKPGIRLAEA